MSSASWFPLVLATALQLLIAATVADETVYASFILARTGERTPLLNQSNDIIQLTALGAESIFNVGSELRTRYISPNSNPSTAIAGLSPDLIDPVQIYLLARDMQYDIASAQSFMQAFYPPTTKNDTIDVDLGTVANGSVSLSPLNGYQYPWIHSASWSDPNSIYADGSSQCALWIENANSWLASDDFASIQATTADLYTRAGDVLGDDNLPSSEYTFGNAYAIADYLSYMYNHNSTFHDLLTNGSYLDKSHYGQLLGLSNHYQWAQYGTGYTASNSTIALVAGQAMASIVSDLFTEHIESLGQSYKLSLVFTEFPAFLSFSALTQLPATPSSDGIDFTAMPDFGSHLLLELFTNDSPVAEGQYPAESDLRVRLLYRNGTDTSTPLTNYPMFGTSQSSLAWDDFKSRLDTITLEGTIPTTPNGSSLEAWCANCNSWADTYFCLYVNEAAQAAVFGNGASTPDTGKSGMSNAVAGAIGAVATLCFFGLVLFLGVGCLGWRVTRMPYGGEGTSGAPGVAAQVQRSSGGFKGSMKLASDTDLPAGAGSEPKHGRISSWEMKNGAGITKPEANTASRADTWRRRREEDEMSERVNPFMDPVQPRETV